MFLLSITALVFNGVIILVSLAQASASALLAIAALPFTLSVASGVVVSSHRVTHHPALVL
jgi:hypothetical protein